MLTKLKEDFSGRITNVQALELSITPPTHTLSPCSSPVLEVGSEKDPALSFTAGVEFELRFRPYAQRIYRTALIVTQSPARAKQVEREICQKAWRTYSPMPATDFTRWLARLLQQAFAEQRIHS
jgi:hypothetical protein